MCEDYTWQHKLQFSSIWWPSRSFNSHDKQKWWPSRSFNSHEEQRCHHDAVKTHLLRSSFYSMGPISWRHAADTWHQKRSLITKGIRCTCGQKCPACIWLDCQMLARKSQESKRPICKQVQCWIDSMKLLPVRISPYTPIAKPANTEFTAAWRPRSLLTKPPLHTRRPGRSW